jgi:hypothetical protein
MTEPGKFLLPILIATTVASIIFCFVIKCICDLDSSDCFCDCDCDCDGC